MYPAPSGQLGIDGLARRSGGRSANAASVPERGRRYWAYVDMSGGSSDDAVLSIGHADGRVAVIDLVAKQIGEPPFDPHAAVRHFAGVLGQTASPRSMATPMPARRSGATSRVSGSGIR